MRTYLTTHITIALLALTVAGVLIGAGWYIDRTLAHVERDLTERIDAHVTTLSELAMTTDRNGADALTERIIADCPRRSEFEALLNELDTLAPKELINMQLLFESCGAFYAERKALMVARIQQEFSVIEEHLAILSRIRDLTQREQALMRWKEFITLEDARSAALAEQTALQAEIIELLISGQRSGRLIELVREAQNVAESLSVTDVQIDTIRNELAPS